MGHYVKKKQSYYSYKMKRTIQKQKMKDFCMVFLLIILLPYTCALLFSDNKVPINKEEVYKTVENNNFKVVLTKTFGTQEISFDEYLIGALASEIPGEYNAETIKAQAVILRSACFYALTNKTGIISDDLKKDMVQDDFVMDQKILQKKYLTKKNRYLLWGDNAEQYEQKFLSAVRETSGLVIYHENKIIDPPFFRLSNGKTRDGGEVTYLKPVSCESDVLSKEFLNKQVFTKEKFNGILKQIDKTDNPTKKISLELDDENYVKQVTIGNTTIEGEQFRTYFSLVSSCYTIIEKNDEITIETKGIGHGLGFCQYAANQMADSEDDFLTILHFFFQKIDIQKIV